MGLQRVGCDWATFTFTDPWNPSSSVFFFQLHIDSKITPFKIFIYLFIWPRQTLVAACNLFSFDMWGLVLWPGIEPKPPALGAQSLSHWTSREVPEKNISDNMSGPALGSGDTGDVGRMHLVLHCYVTINPALTKGTWEPLCTHSLSNHRDNALPRSYKDNPIVPVLKTGNRVSAQES